MNATRKTALKIVTNVEPTVDQVLTSFVDPIAIRIPGIS
jgi:hypothetical protein